LSVISSRTSSVASSRTVTSAQKKVIPLWAGVTACAETRWRKNAKTSAALFMRRRTGASGLIQKQYTLCYAVSLPFLSGDSGLGHHSCTPGGMQWMGQAESVHWALWLSSNWAQTRYLLDKSTETGMAFGRDFWYKRRVQFGLGILHLPDTKREASWRLGHEIRSPNRCEPGVSVSQWANYCPNSIFILAPSAGDDLNNSYAEAGVHGPSLVQGKV
jgi:hypothetical protein